MDFLPEVALLMMFLILNKYLLWTQFTDWLLNNQATKNNNTATVRIKDSFEVKPNMYNYQTMNKANAFLSTGSGTIACNMHIVHVVYHIIFQTDEKKDF